MCCHVQRFQPRPFATAIQLGERLEFLGLDGSKRDRHCTGGFLQDILMVLIYKASPCCLSSFNLGARSQGVKVHGLGMRHSFRTLAACDDQTSLDGQLGRGCASPSVLWSCQVEDAPQDLAFVFSGALFVSAETCLVSTFGTGTSFAVSRILLMSG